MESRKIDGGYAWLIMVVTLLCGFVPGSNMAKFIALAPVFIGEFALDPALIGYVVASFYLMGLVMAFPAVAFVNKIGMKGAIGISTIVSVIGCVMGALAPNLGVFIVSRIFEGAAFGIMGVAGASAIGPWFSPKKRSLPLAIWSMWVAACMAVCPIMFGWLSEAAGVPWTGIWWGTMVYDIVVGVLFILVYRKPANSAAEEAEAQSAGKASLRRVLHSRMLWAIALIFLFDEAAYMAINGFITTYLNVELGTTLVFANAVFSLFGFMGAVFPPISGAITQKFNNHRWVLLVGIIVAIIYTALVFHIKDPNMFYPLSLLAGFVGGAVPSILWQFCPNTVENEDDIPAANAFLAFTQNVGMLIGALIIGNAITIWGWGMGSWIGMLPLYFICLILFFAFGCHKHLKLSREQLER